VLRDQDQDTTDLIKCMDELEAWERRTEAATVRVWPQHHHPRLCACVCVCTPTAAVAHLQRQHPVLICGALSGRFDHVLHAVHFLHRHDGAQRQVFLVSSENVACLLHKARGHRLQHTRTRAILTWGGCIGCAPHRGGRDDGGAHVCAAAMRRPGHHHHHGPAVEPRCVCLVPTGSASLTPARYTRAERALCSFGGLLSTSNALLAPVVTVETDAPVVWTIERNRGAL
jgi:thiamine pyrophosphokinase